VELGDDAPLSPTIKLKRRRRHRAVGASVLTFIRRTSWTVRGIATGVAVTIILIAWAMIARACAPKQNTTLDHFDVLIVLGSPADSDGNPSPFQIERVTEAVNEYERGIAPRIILTGGTTRKQFVEAQVMARVAEAQGIPATQIIEEEHARNTIENACNSLRIMRLHGWHSAEVISGASHLPRTALILSRLPLEWRVHAAPPLESESAWLEPGLTAVEILETVRYLVWARETEPCSL
jgi:uncharacterized SAM-binding protein YcdF (DUF218 family)